MLRGFLLFLAKFFIILSLRSGKLSIQSIHVYRNYRVEGSDIMKIDQVIALQIEGENYSLGTVLRFANLQGKFDLIDDYITISLIADLCGRA